MTLPDPPVLHVVMRREAYYEASALAVFFEESDANEFVRAVDQQRGEVHKLLHARKISFEAAQAMMTLDPGCDPTRHVGYYAHRVPLVTGPLTEAGLHPWGLAEAKQTMAVMQEPAHLNNALAVALGAAYQTTKTEGAGAA